jgi:hypothetical protein
VIRASEPTGELLYENAPTKSGERFEVERVMAAPSFEGVRLQLRYRDRSIEQEVRRLAIAKTALIGFIDLMLLAGLGSCGRTCAASCACRGSRATSSRT